MCISVTCTARLLSEQGNDWANPFQISAGHSDRQIYSDATFLSERRGKLQRNAARNLVDFVDHVVVSANLFTQFNMETSQPQLHVLLRRLLRERQHNRMLWLDGMITKCQYH